MHAVRAKTGRRISVALAALACSAATLAAPESIAFAKIPPAKQDKAWRQTVCAQPGLDCSGDVTLYAAPKLGATTFFAILEKGPALVRLEQGPPWRVVDRWRFDDYVHTANTSDTDTEDGEAKGADDTPLKIYPALYPLDDKDFAAAVIKTYFEGYSGGGSEAQVADFVSLAKAKATAAHGQSAPTVFASVPFSCSVMIRACFSEAEYKHSPHCHDENSAFLTIGYQPTAKGRYDWALTWHEVNWPAGVPAKRKQTSQTHATLQQTDTPDIQAERLRSFNRCDDVENGKP